MMQMILTAIAEGNLRMGMETMEHNSELKNAMKRCADWKKNFPQPSMIRKKSCLKNWETPKQKPTKAIHNRVLSMVFVWVH